VKELKFDFNDVPNFEEEIPKIIEDILDEKPIVAKIKRKKVQLRDKPEFIYYQSLKNTVINYPNLAALISPEMYGKSNYTVNRHDGILMPFLYRMGDYKIITNRIKQVIDIVLKDFIMYEIFAFNCMLRRKEGFFINQSLVQMKTTITNFMIYSMSKKMKISTVTSMIPQLLYYMQPSDDKCINKNYKN
jgi:hypothetical protein